MVILKVEVTNFTFRVVGPECDSPVPGDAEALGSFPPGARAGEPSTPEASEALQAPPYPGGKQRMSRNLSMWAKGRPDGSSRSINRRSPRWTTFPIFIKARGPGSVSCQATLYKPATAPDSVSKVDRPSPRNQVKRRIPQAGTIGAFHLRSAPIASCGKFKCAATRSGGVSAIHWLSDKSA